MQRRRPSSRVPTPPPARKRGSDGHGTGGADGGNETRRARMARIRAAAARERGDGDVRQRRARPRRVHRRDAGQRGDRRWRDQARHAVAARRRRRRRDCAARLHRRAHGCLRNDGARARHAALRQSDDGLARRRLCVSAAREGRGRSSRHARRRARHPGPDQGAHRGAAHLRGGKGRREEGDARRAGAAEHVHDERRAHRALRGDRCRPRIPADADLRRRELRVALSDGDHAALHPGNAHRRRR